MQDEELLENTDYELKLFNNNRAKFNLPELIKLRSTSSNEGSTELNVLLLSKQLDTDPSQVLFNQVLDALIFNMTDNKTSLLKKQKSAEKNPANKLI